eukprot:13950185-Alexandrium_andersonii.AAC.1
MKAARRSSRRSRGATLHAGGVEAELVLTVPEEVEVAVAEEVPSFLGSVWPTSSVAAAPEAA